MILTIPTYNEIILHVEAEPVLIDERMKTVIHQHPSLWDGQWTVSEETTGCHIAHSENRADAIELARVKMVNISDEELKKAIAKRLNDTSDLFEYLAFKKLPEPLNACAPT